MSYAPFASAEKAAAGGLLDVAQGFDREIKNPSRKRKNLFDDGMAFPSLGDLSMPRPSPLPGTMSAPFKPLVGVQPEDVSLESLRGFVSREQMPMIDAGMLPGQDANWNNQPITVTMKSDIGSGFYAERGVNGAEQLESLLTKGSPIFRARSSAVPGRYVVDNHVFMKLADVNHALKQISVDTRVQRLKEEFSFIGALSEVTDIREFGDRVRDMQVELIIRGPADMFHIWSNCMIRPRTGCYLHLIFVQRHRGFELEDDRAYRDKKVWSYNKKLARRLGCRFSDLKNHRYWTLLPHVSGGPNPDPYWLSGPGWKGSAITIGIDSGEGARAAENSDRAERAYRFVYGTEESHVMNKECAMTRVHIGHSGYGFLGS